MIGEKSTKEKKKKTILKNILDNPDYEQISKSQPQQLSQTPHHFFLLCYNFLKISTLLLTISEISY